MVFGLIDANGLSMKEIVISIALINQIVIPLVLIYIEMIKRGKAIMIVAVDAPNKIKGVFKKILTLSMFFILPSNTEI